MPIAHCPMPIAPCPMPHALCLTLGLNKSQKWTGLFWNIHEASQIYA
ncbi:MAG: hypothetical protein KME31_25000 [Tolypothrix carrinoi HA7290-LM1]|nr:hypothetical protein [Tolypothrix carrinoi HA7290-LM1]